MVVLPDYPVVIASISTMLCTFLSERNHSIVIASELCERSNLLFDFYLYQFLRSISISLRAFLSNKNSAIVIAKERFLRLKQPIRAVCARDLPAGWETASSGKERLPRSDN